MEKTNAVLQSRQESQTYTATVAKNISRRSFLKGAGALVLALGLSVKLPGVALAHTIVCAGNNPPGCSMCLGQCSGAYSVSARCCRGGVCLTTYCDCPGVECACWDQCPGYLHCFYAKAVVCDDGHYKGFCPGCSHSYCAC